MKKKFLAILLCAVLTVPAYAVFNEKNISQTISVLRHELHMAWLEKNSHDIRHENASRMDEVQHLDMVNTVKWINELTLILYSQEIGFTLDQTYAMDCVRYEYNRFNKRRHPHFSNIEAIDDEIERYQHLIEALRLLPPKLENADGVSPFASDNADTSETDIDIEQFNQLLDSLISTFTPALVPEERIDTTPKPEERKSLLKELARYGRMSTKKDAGQSNGNMVFLSEEAQVDRDSCIAYASAIVESYNRQKERIKEDEYYFGEMKRKIQQTYEYASLCFKEIETYVFVTGQENYLYVMANLRKYAYDAASDMQQKYGAGDSAQDLDELRTSQWRGVVLAFTILCSLLRFLVISSLVIILCCVVLKNVKPFNTEWFRQTRPATLMLIISVAYSLFLTIRIFFPMNNFTEVAAVRILIYFWFVIALLLSLLVGMDKEKVRDGLKVFVPILTMGFLLVLIRAVFLPDKMIHLALAPILLMFLIWQILVTGKFKANLKTYKNIIRLQYITAVIFGLALLMAVLGYSLLSLMFLMWWIFQGAALATLASISYLLKYIEKTSLAKKKEQYAATHKMVSKDEKGDYIRVTWLFDLIDKAVLPVAGILSLLACIWLSFGVFNLPETSQAIFHKSFFDFTSSDGMPILQVSLWKLVSVCASFFIYRYLNYLVRSIYRANKFDKLMAASRNDFIRKNDVNLTLAYNVIGMIIWGLFVIYTITILKIPLGALSIVAAGLATGVGLALKDVLNNFIYGIQLMSGRLRVGDVLECDGIRGTVEKISYQSTEIQTLAGAVISFTNSALFNKNFQNLTKNSPYEYVKIIISVSYGEDVEKVRNLIQENLKEYLSKKDKYGRYLVEKKAGIWITLDEFCDSSVNVAIKQHVLVEHKFSYTAEINERIYKLFNENGIVIPFPQQEVSILNFQTKETD